MNLSAQTWLTDGKTQALLAAFGDVPLRFVEPGVAGRIPVSFEFRTFWWRPGGEGDPRCVGFGPYWWEASPYPPTEAERASALALAGEAARRVLVPFLVVDVAMTAEGRWIVIECNDGQESGYNGVQRLLLWQRIVEAERAAQGRSA